MESAFSLLGLFHSSNGLDNKEFSRSGNVLSTYPSPGSQPEIDFVVTSVSSVTEKALVHLYRTLYPPPRGDVSLGWNPASDSEAGGRIFEGDSTRGEDASMFRYLVGWEWSAQSGVLKADAFSDSSHHMYRLCCTQNACFIFTRLPTNTVLRPVSAAVCLNRSCIRFYAGLTAFAGVAQHQTFFNITPESPIRRWLRPWTWLSRSSIHLS